MYSFFLTRPVGILSLPGVGGLKCVQASRVSVYLSAFTFLSVVFIDFFPSHLFCFLDKTGVFVGILSCTSCFSFLFSMFTMSIRFFVFFFSLLLVFLLLHLL